MMKPKPFKGWAVFKGDDPRFVYQDYDEAVIVALKRCLPEIEPCIALLHSDERENLLKRRVAYAYRVVQVEIREIREVQEGE